MSVDKPTETDKEKKKGKKAGWTADSDLEKDVRYYVRVR